MNCVSWKRRLEVAADLKQIYPAVTVEEAELRLGELETKWGAEYLPIDPSWRRNCGLWLNEILASSIDAKRQVL